MSHQPRCIIVTGRPGAGKTTLSRKLALQLSMPVISRDDLKTGYLNTLGASHAELPAHTNALVTEVFFDLVNQYLARKISVIIEAAFQHAVWETRMAHILELSHPCFLICSLDANIAAQRHLQRGLNDPKREWYHGDQSVALYRATGEMAAPSEYVIPCFKVPTIEVSTQSDYAPSLEEIAAQIHL